MDIVFMTLYCLDFLLHVFFVRIARNNLNLHVALWEMRRMTPGIFTIGSHKDNQSSSILLEDFKCCFSSC
jgi:hypothetical protein